MSDMLIRKEKIDLLRIEIYDTEEAMGQASAAYGAQVLKELCGKQDEVNILVSTARSQESMMRVLEATGDIDWSKINLFHVDEYIGLPEGDEHRLSFQLLGYFFKTTPFRATFFMNPLASDLEIECRRYEDLLKKHPVDISFVGIGDNGHLAFNEPNIADFKDPVFVKTVDIDPVSKNQLVQHKNYDGPEQMPDRAFTLTLPALMSAKAVICTVPFVTKARATARSLKGPVETACPASVMRRHPNAVLFLDRDSASLL
jgi:glucosamine-6-phosphate deaminase